jgi:type II secretory pathway component GspD/PulD (secretin)
VPGLSRIPVLGALFRDKHTDRQRSARLFIIRPHVVTTPVAG